MGTNNLPLTESIATNCNESLCPWFKDGMCGLVGNVLIRMGSSGIVSQSFGAFERLENKPARVGWVEENQDKFHNFGEGCVVNASNQNDLKEGKMPSMMIMIAADDEQQQHNTKFVAENATPAVQATNYDSSKMIIIHRAAYIPQK